MSNSEQSLSALSGHNSSKHGSGHGVSLPLQTFDVMENAMYFDLTKYENTIAIFAFVLIAIFALAALLDNRWRKTAQLSKLGPDDRASFPPKRVDSGDKIKTGDLYACYADLSARSLGTAEPLITLRGEVHKNLDGN